MWSPASSLWGRLLDHEADTALVGDDNPSIVRSPLVIASLAVTHGARGMMYGESETNVPSRGYRATSRGCRPRWRLKSTRVVSSIATAEA